MMHLLIVDPLIYLLLGLGRLLDVASLVARSKWHLLPVSHPCARWTQQRLALWRQCRDPSSLLGYIPSRSLRRSNVSLSRYLHRPLIGSVHAGSCLRMPLLALGSTHHRGRLILESIGIIGSPTLNFNQIGLLLDASKQRLWRIAREIIGCI